MAIENPQCKLLPVCHTYSGGEAIFGGGGYWGIDGADVTSSLSHLQWQGSDPKRNQSAPQDNSNNPIPSI